MLAEKVTPIHWLRILLVLCIFPKFGYHSSHFIIFRLLFFTRVSPVPFSSFAHVFSAFDLGVATCLPAFIKLADFPGFSFSSPAFSRCNVMFLSFASSHFDFSVPRAFSSCTEEGTSLEFENDRTWSSYFIFVRILRWSFPTCIYFVQKENLSIYFTTRPVEQKTDSTDR